MSDKAIRHNWHVTLHPIRGSVATGETVQWQGWSFKTFSTSGLGEDVVFPVSFDDAVAAINRLPNGYAEGDGSFGIVGPEGVWKLVGTLYEMQAGLRYVELMGWCPQATLRELLAALGVSEESCCFQMLRGGFFVSFAEFSRWNRFF